MPTIFYGRVFTLHTFLKTFYPEELARDISEQGTDEDEYWEDSFPSDLVLGLSDGSSGVSKYFDVLCGDSDNIQHKAFGNEDKTETHLEKDQNWVYVGVNMDFWGKRMMEQVVSCDMEGVFATYMKKLEKLVDGCPNCVADFDSPRLFIIRNQ